MVISGVPGKARVPGSTDLRGDDAGKGRGDFRVAAGDLRGLHVLLNPGGLGVQLRAAGVGHLISRLRGLELGRGFIKFLVGDRLFVAQILHAAEGVCARSRLALAPVMALSASGTGSEPR